MLYYAENDNTESLRHIVKSMTIIAIYQITTQLTCKNILFLTNFISNSLGINSLLIVLT